MQAVSFIDVPEFATRGSPKPNTFSIILDGSGDIMLWYKSIMMNAPAVIGLSPGPELTDGSDAPIDFTSSSIRC